MLAIKMFALEVEAGDHHRSRWMHKRQESRINYYYYPGNTNIELESYCFTDRRSSSCDSNSFIDDQACIVIFVSP